MAAEDQIKIGIDVQVQNAQAIGQLAQSTKALGEEYKRLKALGDQTASGQAALGTALQSYTQSQGQLRAALIQTTQAHGDFSQAIRGATSAMAQQAGPFGGLVQALSGVNLAAGLAAGAVAGIGVALVGSAEHAANYALELRNASQVSGLAVNTLAALRLGARESGKDFGELQQGLFKFSRTLGEAVADSGSTAAKMFQSLGVEIVDASGKARSEEDVFRDIADRIAGAGTASEKSRIAFEAFGRGGVAFALLLQNGMADLEAQIRKMGTALSPDAERQALAFHASTVKVQESINGLNLAFGGGAAGPLADFNEELAKGIQRMTRFVDITKQLDAGLSRKFNLAKFGSPSSVPFGPTPPPAVEFGPSSAAFLESQRAAAEAAAKISDEIQKQYNATLATISLDAQRVNWGAMLVADEIKALEAMEGQVKSKRELTAIQKQLNALEIGTSDRPYGPPAPGPWGSGMTAQQMIAAGSPPVGLGMLKPVDTTLGASANLKKAIAENQSALEKWAETLAKLTPLEKAAQNITESSNQAIAAGVHGFVSDVLSGVDTIGQAFSKFFDQVAQQVLESAISTSILAAIGLQAGGTAVYAQAGGTFAPFHAQTGIITSGYRGHDTVPVMGGRGLAGRDEMIVSHADTDLFREVLGALKVGMGKTSNDSKGSELHAPIIVNITVSAPNVSDRAGLRAHLTENIAPILRNLQSRGVIRPGR